ncbi:RidA family protein [Pedobacter mendelii]|uniref:Enamine deaminase RidA n=1 Tax=Pedobacter mendelii TaxID=1908240 RepID=A0ABQ2BR64_9SPHI|nr:RidA family protein [Pedobacter mendelii]GGI29541.1 enamine deaminase RidA [Pedobacter mendelii]
MNLQGKLKKITKLLLITSIISVPVMAQNKKQTTMEKRIINPWEWQDKRRYVQAVEVKSVESTLYVSGQTAISDEGLSSKENMKSQLIHALKNLEKVIGQAGFENKNIVRLNIYTTSSTELFDCFDIFQDWITKNGVKQATTLFEVKSLFETLKVELEATVVK